MTISYISALQPSFVATGTLVANRFVTKLIAQTGADGYAIGVCRNAASSGDRVTVDCVGLIPVEAGAAITLGDTLKVDSSGRAITWATSGAKVGIAMEAASAAGDLISVLLIPNVA